MKITVDLPDPLLRSIKVRAAQEDRKLKDMLAELLRRGLAAPEPIGARVNGHKVQLPLIHTGPASSAAELTPERVAEILEGQDVEELQGACP